LYVEDYVLYDNVWLKYISVIVDGSCVVSCYVGPGEVSVVGECCCVGEGEVGGVKVCRVCDGGSDAVECCCVYGECSLCEVEFCVVLYGEVVDGECLVDVCYGAVLCVVVDEEGAAGTCLCEVGGACASVLGAASECCASVGGGGTGVCVGGIVDGDSPSSSCSSILATFFLVVSAVCGYGSGAS